MTLPQDASENLVQRLERHWAMGLSPDWQTFLLNSESPDWCEHAIRICRIDLNWRLEHEAASETTNRLVSLVQEVYWPELKSRVALSEIVALVELEYQLRWNVGLPTRAADFARVLNIEIQSVTLTIEWTCPHPNCGLEHSTSETDNPQFVCPKCNSSWMETDVFPRSQRWVTSNAPNWLRRQLADGPNLIGAPGTYGAAYTVVDEDTHQQKTVVKVLHSWWTGNPQIVERFMRESRILALLDGEGTPYLRRSGRLPDGRYYYQMQRIDGADLSSYVSNSDFPAILDRLEEIVGSIAVAHGHGILHRDISPRNVVVDMQRNRAIVLDWGLGLLRGDHERSDSSEPQLTELDVADATCAGTRLGSPGFQAPELQNDGTRASTSSDVFSLGSLFIYCLTRGKVRAGAGVAGNSADDHENGYAAATRSLERLKQVKLLACEDELFELCRDCIHPDATCRPASAIEVANRLQQWRVARQNRLEVLPVVRIRNRLAWTLLVVSCLSSLIVISLTFAWKKNAENALKFQLGLNQTIEASRQQEVEFSRSQEKLAAEKAREAESARAFSSLLIDVFKSADPLALEGAGFRDTTESVLQLSAVDLLVRISDSIDHKELGTLEARTLALDGIGNALRGLGEASRAETLLLEAESIQLQPSYSGSPEDRALVPFHLAMLYHDIRELELAEKYFTTTLKLVEQFQLPLHFRNQVEFRFAWLLAESLRIDEARNLFEKIKNDRTAALGPTSYEVQITELALLLLYLRDGDTASILAGLNRLNSTDSKMLDLVKNWSIIQILRRAGGNKQAAAAYEKILSQAEEYLPAHHPLLGMLLGDMAGFYRSTGNMQRALQLAERALTIARNTIPTHPQSLMLYRELGKEYESLGRRDEARSLYQEVLNLLKNRNSPSLTESIESFEAALRRLESTQN